MKRFIQRRPSAAMIVAVIALIAAIGGTAVAGSGFLSTKKFKKFKRNTAVFRTQAAAAVKGPLTYASVTVTIPPTAPGNAGTGVAAPCPVGTDPTGGGIKVSNNLVEYIVDSHPTVGGWAGTVQNDGTANHTALVTAICAQSATTGTRPAN